MSITLLASENYVAHPDAVSLGLLVLRGVVDLGDLVPVAAAGLLHFAMVGVGARLFARASERDYRRAAQWLLLVLASSILI